MPAAAFKTLASQLQMTISAALTEIPFLDNIELDPGENKQHELLGVNMAYATPISTGVRGMGTLTADVLAYDPTDSVHQKLAEAFNDDAEIVGAVVLGGTTKTISVKYRITKFPVSVKAASVIAGKLEAVITEKITLPEA